MSFSRPPSLTSENTRSERPPALFALIIGIDKYKDASVTDLGGAVGDAQAIREFLISDAIGISEDRIVQLTNESATREAMVNAIKNLASNPAISKQDPILIFYAGHGARTVIPLQQWNTSDGYIQMLCPHDFARYGSITLPGQGLFDLKLGMLLDEIAQQKSDNITIILDCCHSGSGVRNHLNDNKAPTPRFIELPPTYAIPAHVLKQDLEDHDVVTKGSYVLLAACKRNEGALESNNRGVFTSALLELLQKEGVDQLTYKDIITRLPDLPVQHPQCEGINQDRILFDAKVASSLGTKWYSIYTANDSRYPFRLDAGEAHGVTAEATFDVYRDKSKTSPPIGSVVAVMTSAFETLCSVQGNSFSESLTRSAYAVQTRVGKQQDLALLIEDKESLSALVTKLKEEMEPTNTSKRSFRLVDNINQNPDVIIKTNDNHVEFHLNEPLCRRYGLSRMPFGNDINVNNTDYIMSILRSAADFYRNLHHSSRDSTLTESITIECLKLVLSEKLLVPDPNGQGLNINGTIFINVDERINYGNVRNVSVKYGYKITNNSDQSLHATLFYFDLNSLSITRLDLPTAATSGFVDIPLPKNNVMSVGYGDGGVNPQIYWLGPNQSVEVGFLKLYVSTTFVDFSVIRQDSPLPRSRATQSMRPAASASLTEDELQQRSGWGTITIPIILHHGDFER